MILRYDQGMTTHHDATDHPLTEGRAQDIYSGTNPVGALRAAFDAGREYERDQELPTEDWAVIVPADGREYIEAQSEGSAYYAREAMLLPKGRWNAIWRKEKGHPTVGGFGPEYIIPGTWKVEEK